MPVRHLNKGFFDMVPELIPTMSGNQMPDIGGLDKGIWRRLKFVKWPVTLTDEEQRPLPEVVADFMSEAPGILNWLIEGALIFLREGLKDPPAVRELTQSHREDSDPVGAFVRDCVKPEPRGPGVQARDMFNGFKNYCDANAIKPWGEKDILPCHEAEGLHNGKTSAFASGPAFALRACRTRCPLTLVTDNAPARVRGWREGERKTLAL